MPCMTTAHIHYFTANCYRNYLAFSISVCCSCMLCARGKVHILRSQNTTQTLLINHNHILISNNSNVCVRISIPFFERLIIRACSIHVCQPFFSVKTDKFIQIAFVFLEEAREKRANYAQTGGKNAAKQCIRDCNKWHR